MRSCMHARIQAVAPGNQPDQRIHAKTSGLISEPARLSRSPGCRSLSTPKGVARIAQQAGEKSNGPRSPDRPQQSLSQVFS
jgi:hypothetical protein